MNTRQYWPPANTIPCSQCEGSSKYRSLFAAGQCANCEGTGITDQAGTSLPLHTSVLLLIKQLKTERLLHRQLLKTPGVQAVIDAEKQKARDQKEVQERGYGDNRYHGD